MGGENRLGFFPIIPLSVIPFLAVGMGRIVDQVSLTVEPGAVAGTVIACFVRVPFQPASHMGAVGNQRLVSGRQDMLCQTL
mgnify:CR=1 FL=1